MELKIKKLTNDAILPYKHYKYDAGFDMFANERVIIKPGEHKKVKTGIAVDIPEGHVGLLTARSGINHKSSLRCLLGIVDAGYQGDVSVLIDNRSNRLDSEPDLLYPTINLKDYSYNYQSKTGFENTYEIKKGDKIAQLVIMPISIFDEVTEVTEFDSHSERGDGGFGSTQN